MFGATLNNDCLYYIKSSQLAVVLFHVFCAVRVLVNIQAFQRIVLFYLCHIPVQFYQMNVSYCFWQLKLISCNFSQLLQMQLHNCCQYFLNSSFLCGAFPDNKNATISLEIVHLLIPNLWTGDETILCLIRAVARFRRQ